MNELTIQPAGGSPGEPQLPPRVQTPPDWSPWSAPLALLGGLAIAVVAVALIDVPAALLGVKVTSKNLPGGLVIADTAAQDLGFVAAVLLFARLGGRAVRAWMFGLRPPRMSWWGVVGRILLLLAAVLAFAEVWDLIFHPGEDKLLEKLGTNQGAALLVLSAVLTCVVAPICEEFLFRGYFFTALRNWRGTWPAALITGLVFGGVHLGSAPLADLAPLAALGFGLCLLYRNTESLYPCIVVHSLNNSVAFGSLEDWSAGEVVLLMAGALGAIWLVWLALTAARVISAETSAIRQSA